MATLSRRTSHPVAEMLDWLETGTPFSLRGFGLAPFVRVEDFMDDGTYVIRAELPGVDPDKDIQLEVTGDTLTIRGERREEQKEKNRREFHYGSFYRSVELPRGVKADDIKASYDDGVLEIRVSIPHVEEKARQIPVNRNE
jgi:HSP20 family molecular chaperone IbpA